MATSCGAPSFQRKQTRHWSFTQMLYCPAQSPFSFSRRFPGGTRLDGDGSVVFAIAGEVDDGHPALAQLALDGVAVGQGGAEVVEGAHRVKLARRDDVDCCRVRVFRRGTGHGSPDDDGFTALLHIHSEECSTKAGRGQRDAARDSSPGVTRSQ